MSTVQEYLTKLEEGKTIDLRARGGAVWLSVEPCDAKDPARGLDEDTSPKDVLEAYRALAAWLRHYRSIHTHPYRMLVAGNPE